jgi:bacterioferritin
MTPQYFGKGWIGTMKIDLEHLLAELNKDLEFEYASIIQYDQHAATLSGPQFGSIQKELLIHAQEELQHAVLLSTQITFLGGVPSLEVEKRFTSESSVEMLQQDLRGEERAIKRYRKRIQQAETLKEYGLRRILEDILIMEEEHRRDIANALAN